MAKHRDLSDYPQVLKGSPTHPVDRLRQEGLGPVRRPPDGMVHCPDCGAYLGDYVNGVLYKFGKEVVEPHACER